MDDLDGNTTHPNLKPIIGHGEGISNSTDNSTNSDWLHTPRMEFFVYIFALSCSTAVIVGGLIPYIPQYLKIKRSFSSDGFSTYVCLTLLLANILRIAFWFGHRFELPLLLQSFVMIAGMMAMMELCVRVKSKSSLYAMPGNSIRANSSRSRRSIIGKILSISSTPDSINGSNNESTPIYSVTSGSESSSSPSPTANSNLLMISTSTEVESDIVPYHQQEFSGVGSPRVCFNTSTSTQGNITRNANSFRSIESPIIGNMLDSPVTLDSFNHHEQAHGNDPQTLNHSFSNGYISKHRRYRLAIVKWLGFQNFWNWDSLLSYVKFLSLFTLVLALLTYTMSSNNLYIESLGYVSVFTESMLGVPQLYRNFSKKSTRGMSVEMVIMWLFGDLFRTLYFILRHTPVQFIACGSIQVCMDILILIQVFWYRRRNATYYNKLPKST